MEKATLYYDGACPLCAREMKHLNQLKRDSLELVDIHGVTLTEEMPTKEQLLLNLHLKRGDSWVVGADANVAAWQHTRFGLLWAWLRWPLIRNIIDPVYAFWAKRRYEGLYGKLSSNDMRASMAPNNASDTAPQMGANKVPDASSAIDTDEMGAECAPNNRIAE